MKARSAIATLIVTTVAVFPATMVGVTTASAAPSPGPSISHLHFRWIPGTGNVHADAVVKCARGVRQAHVTVELAQSDAGARASTKVRCDGRSHRLHLVLDPKKGHFTPGKSGLSWSTTGCRGDVCWMGIADGFTHIDRPGKARGPQRSR
jgi:hypothetical protein